MIINRHLEVRITKDDLAALLSKELKLTITAESISFGGRGPGKKDNSYLVIRVEEEGEPQNVQ